jgi:hypothetical protein
MALLATLMGEDIDQRTKMLPNILQPLNATSCPTGNRARPLLKAPNHLTGPGEQSCDFLATPITKYRCPAAGADEQFTSTLVNATTVYLTLDNLLPKRAKNTPLSAQR